MKQAYLISIGAAVLATLGIVAAFYGGKTWSQCRDFSEANVTVGEHTLRVALADSHIERTHGLSGCRQLPPDSGMYFLYDQPIAAQFWMKDMFVPIDIIWIAEGRIIGIEANVPPPETREAADLPRYQPPAPITGVLEIPAGKAAEYGFAPGTVVTLIQ